MANLFPIRIEVEETAVGGVLRMLKRHPGIARVHLDLELDDKKVPRSNGTNGHGGVRRGIDIPPVNSVIIAELMTGQKNLAYLKEKVVEAGGHEKSVSSALYTLQKRGLTESAGVGLHRLTPKALEELQHKAPAPAESLQLPAPAPAARAKREQGKTIDFVLQSVRDGLTRSEMRKAGEEKHFTERMIDGAITRLKDKEQIMAAGTEQGVYKLTPIKPAKKQHPKPST